jgi:hypothetical protein
MVTGPPKIRWDMTRSRETHTHDIKRRGGAEETTLEWGRL